MNENFSEAYFGLGVLQFEKRENTLAIENFLKWCYKGPPGAIVRKIEKVHGKTEDFREFRVLY